MWNDKCKQSDESSSTQIPLLMSQTVIAWSCYCYGAIHEITCHLFIYAAPGATCKNWNEKSTSSSNVSSAKGVGTCSHTKKRCGNAFPTPLHPWVCDDWCHTNQHYTCLLHSLNQLYQFINILLYSEFPRYQVPEPCKPPFILSNWGPTLSQGTQNSEINPSKQHFNSPNFNMKY